MSTDSEKQYHERREHERFALRVQGMLSHTSKSWPIYIINVSETGSLIALVDDEHALEAGEPVTLSLELGGSEPLQVRGEIAHTKDHYLGVAFDEKTIDDPERLNSLITRLQKAND